MEFSLTQFLGKSLPALLPNPVYAPLTNIFPDFSVRALTPFDEGLFGDNMIFTLNQNLRSRKKNRRNNSSTDDSKTLHFEAQIDNINGAPHLDVENDDMQHLADALDTNDNGKISKGELKRSTITALTNIDLIENHSRDADVTSYWKSEDVYFQYTPKTIILGKPGPGTLEFNTDIVQVGIDDEGNVISFICPQETQEIDSHFVKGSVKSEVEVGEVGGKIDPLTGEGTMYADELAWKFWGDMTIFGKKVSISKEDAAFIPIEDATGTGGLLALESIDRSSHGGGKYDNILSSYYVKGLQGNPSNIQKGALQETLIKAVNVYMPGFANGGTGIQWNIDLQAPIAVIGDEYVNNAHNLEMH
jgi:hypothetical protein